MTIQLMRRFAAVLFAVALALGAAVSAMAGQLAPRRRPLSAVWRR